MLAVGSGRTCLPYKNFCTTYKKLVDGEHLKSYGHLSNGSVELLSPFEVDPNPTVE